MNFWDMTLRGMCCAGWVIGFGAVLGLAVCIVGLICAAMGEIMSGDEEEDEDGGPI